MTISNYPNLPLIEERFDNHLRRMGDHRPRNYDMQMFSQCWDSQRLGLDVDLISQPAPVPVIGYTTIIIDLFTGEAGVFFNETLAYTVKRPGEKFYHDIRERNMLPQSRSGEYSEPVFSVRHA